MGGGGRIVFGSAHAIIATVTKVLSAQGSETLLLGDGVDVGTNEEGYKVEERHPKFVGEEFLGKGEANGRRDPRDAHDSPETDLDSGANLVICTRPGNESHGDQVNAVLDGGDLERMC